MRHRCREGCCIDVAWHITSELVFTIKCTLTTSMHCPAKTPFCGPVTTTPSKSLNIAWLLLNIPLVGRKIANLSGNAGKSETLITLKISHNELCWWFLMNIWVYSMDCNGNYSFIWGFKVKIAIFNGFTKIWNRRKVVEVFFFFFFF